MTTNSFGKPHPLFLISIVGPTAVGKTALAIRLAQEFSTEIISADSRQFYKELNIGTAKPRQEELATVPHHFINSHSITEEYSAGDYETEALQKIYDLFHRNNPLILVGGSGLFIDAVCKGLDVLPKPLKGVRETLVQLYKEKGITYLQAHLKEVDPDYYRMVDLNNPQRIMRALEVFNSTGIPFSAWRKKAQPSRNFITLTIGLNQERATLYEKINKRVDRMMEEGLMKEVENLMPFKDRPPLLTVGYSELFDFFADKHSLEEAVYKIKQNTRRYAKRQVTWFKKNKDTEWFEPEDLDGILHYLHQTIQRGGE